MQRLGIIAVLVLLVLGFVYYAPWKKSDYLDLLKQEEFDELIEIEEQLQSSRETNSEDMPALHLFYAEIGGDYGLSEQQWQNRRALLKRWLEAYPDSEAATLALAFHHYRYGWQKRGTAVRDEVRESGYEQFHNHLDTSLELARSIEESADDNPALWELVLYIGIAKSSPPPAFNAIYDEVTKHFPWYLPYHIAKAQYVSQRWYGSHQELAEFSKASNKRFLEYFGNRLYGRLQWNLRLNEMFDNGQTDWSLLEPSFRSIIDEYPTRANYIKFGILACLARDWREVGEIMPHITPAPTNAEWTTRHFEHCGRMTAKQDIEPGITVAELQNKTERSRIVSPGDKSGPAFTLPPEEKEPEDISEKDPALLALAEPDAPYESVKKAATKLAEENVRAVEILDRHGITLLQQDFAQVLFLIARRDADQALKHIDRVPRQRYLLLDRIRTAQQSRLGDDFPAWLWEHPVLWDEDDLEFFFTDPDVVSVVLEKIDTESGHRRDWLTSTSVQLLATSRPGPLFDHIMTLEPKLKKRYFRTAIGLMLKDGQSEKALLMALKHDDERHLRRSDTLKQIARVDENVIELVDKHNVSVSDNELDDLVRRVAIENPVKAKNYLHRLPKDGLFVRRKIGDFYKRRLKEEFPDWLRDHPEYISGRDLAVLYEQDTEGTLKLLHGLPDTEYRNYLLERSAHELIVHDVATAMRFVKLPETRRDWDTLKEFESLVRSAPMDVRRWMSESDIEIPDVAISVVAEVSLSIGLPNTFEWVNQFPPSRALREVRYEGLQKLADNDPARLAQLIPQLQDREIHLAMFMVFDSWMETDAQAATQWTFDQEPGLLRDLGLMQLGHFYVQKEKDFEKGLGLYNQVEDREMQMAALFNLMPALYLEDRALFEEVADNYGLTKDDLARMKHEAESMEQHHEVLKHGGDRQDPPSPGH